MSVEGGWKLQFTVPVFGFIEAAYEPLHVRKITFCIVKGHGHANKFYLNHH
jgi:hypothetical protein